MSETVNNNFTVPPDQDFDTVGFQGSMQQVLQENIGNYVLVDFLIGSEVLTTKQGILYNVASQFLVLYDDVNFNYIVCDIFSVKFVTFLLPGYRPGQVVTPRAMQAAPVTPAVPAVPDAADDVTSDTTAQSAVYRQAAESAPQAAPASAPVSPCTPAQAAYTYAVRRRT